MLHQALELKPVLSLERVASSVRDNGRRGNPRPGCDCEQCFGYCLVDLNEAARRGFQVFTPAGGDAL